MVSGREKKSKRDFTDDIYGPQKERPEEEPLPDYLFEPTQAAYTYCQLVGTANFTMTKITVEIDFGQARKWTERKKRLTGEDGKPIKFNSMVDAMNYMGSMGWEFVQAYTVTVQNQHVYHWLLKKELNYDE